MFKNFFRVVKCVSIIPCNRSLNMKNIIKIVKIVRTHLKNNSRIEIRDIKKNQTLHEIRI